MYDETHTGTGRKILETKFAYEVKNEYKLSFAREREGEESIKFSKVTINILVIHHVVECVCTPYRRNSLTKKREEGG